MNTPALLRFSPLALVAAVVLVGTGALTPAFAKAKKAPVAAAAKEPAPASAEQADAAGRVYYGDYACEDGKKLDIESDPKYPSYVDVVFGKAHYLMKPVLSSTGAVRLEDVRGETLMVQIASKSMLLNVKTAHRLVDGCINAKQVQAEAH